MSHAEISDKLTKIINYADIGNFMDVPFYLFSWKSDCFWLLFTEPEIILLDEAWQWVTNFQQKSSFNQSIGKSGILSSSYLTGWNIYKNCQRIIWLDHGKF
jgi:ABC-type polysaccharide/polyol phosphate transport system ATPase subunit